MVVTKWTWLDEKLSRILPPIDWDPEISEVLVSNGLKRTIIFIVDCIQTAFEKLFMAAMYSSLL